MLVQGVTCATGGGLVDQASNRVAASQDSEEVSGHGVDQAKHVETGAEGERVGDQAIEGRTTSELGPHLLDRCRLQLVEGVQSSQDLSRLDGL